MPYAYDGFNQCTRNAYGMQDKRVGNSVTYIWSFSEYACMRGNAFEKQKYA